MIIKCDACQRDFDCPKKKYNFNNKNGYKIYCSTECYSKSKKHSTIEKCVNCGKDVEIARARKNQSITGNVYCSRSCSASNNNKLFKKWENHPSYKNGISGYRALKLSTVENPKCEKCGFDNLIALDVHHKDRNRKNNNLDNLEILCCNCHMIEHRSKNGDVV